MDGDCVGAARYLRWQLTVCEPVTTPAQVPTVAPWRKAKIRHTIHGMGGFVMGTRIQSVEIQIEEA
jgi:hypothetical protein